VVPIQIVQNVTQVIFYPEQHALQLALMVNTLNLVTIHAKIVMLLVKLALQLYQHRAAHVIQVNIYRHQIIVVLIALLDALLVLPIPFVRLVIFHWDIIIHLL
jgi:hypothetical protein